MRAVALLLMWGITNKGARTPQANGVMNRLLGEGFENAAQAASWSRGR